MRSLFRLIWLLVPLQLLSCSDAGLYALDGRGPSGKDRADYSGEVCIPLAGGDAFPVKVVFALAGGEGVPSEVVGYATDALGTLSSRFSGPFITFSLIAFHTVATGIQGSFVDAATFQSALARYASYQETGPMSIRSALRLSKSILAGDMQTSCRGAVGRTRYMVVLVITNADLSCARDDINVGIDANCAKLASSESCSQCELTVVTGEVKNLVQQFNAGEVVVQPVYVRSVPDEATRNHVAAIANAGGTKPIETDPEGLRDVLANINYSSLQTQLILKRFVAFNRNVQVRNGEILTDSDGDGLPDKDEEGLGLDPRQADTDGDGLMDGIELRMGLDPLTVNIINGCNVSLDDDGDRLNTCEERVLGTNPCMGDTDADGLPDLVEALGHTNPLVPEDLLDTDRDGVSNIDEAIVHSDPLSADIAFQAERGYGYSLELTEPTPDGRACYKVRAENITVVPTLEHPHPLFPGVTIPAGQNDIYFYMQVGRDNDPRGAGVGSLYVDDQLRYSEDKGKQPAGARSLDPNAFILGT
ncbi:thrombospondin type 3 repeat-containing protein [Hyalangium versicolor]|uniref:thrombospondin type 3 repeat-containing protein n=1 Tax=Hyalangium versicolor TaxID=2861190 RepID=UPI001CCD5BFA|nr:thrombospondin type 3 repeat-containing protein [Hyalangium versicolor]